MGQLTSAGMPMAYIPQDRSDVVMKPFRVQLFVTASDLSDWCARWAKPSDGLLAFYCSGTIARLGRGGDIETAFADDAVRWIAIVAQLSNGAEAISGISDIPEALVFEIGRVQGSVLSESSVFSMNPSTRWRDCISKLRKNTSSGCVVRNDTTGAEGLSRIHRYTDAALALLADGVEWRQHPQMRTVFRPQSLA
jgi:hypothetical protein